MKTRILNYVIATLIIAISITTFADLTGNNPFANQLSEIMCQANPKLQAERSQELQTIVAADQKDRQNFLHWTEAEAAQVAIRDVRRRERVAEIFAEGCFHTAADYAAAALVFQHGTVPDHYFQAFIWAKRAVELGDVHQKILMADAIDRYLVKTGHKQLFGTQADASKMDGCFCLEPVESSFPSAERISYTGKSLSDVLIWINSLNVGRACPAAHLCSENMKPTPRGFIPGFW